MQKPLPFVAFLLVLSGCVTSTATEVPREIPDEPVDARFFGSVLDDEARPVEGVLVTLVEANSIALTDASGRFDLGTAAPGNYTLVASHAEYKEAVRALQAASGDRVDVNFTIERLPEFRPHTVMLPLRGHYDCAAEYFIITGHCGILWEFATCGAQSCQEDPVFQQTYQFPIEILPRWETLVSELTWTASASNGLGGMRMYVENTNVTEQAGHSVKVARAQGDEQPLYIRIDRGTIRPEAETYNGTTQQAFIPDEASMQQIRVFPMGLGYDTTSQNCLPGFGCFLGLGAGAGIDFELNVTIFYNARAPEGFLAAPQ
jgi:hypothetical protein